MKSCRCSAAPAGAGWTKPASCSSPPTSCACWMRTPGHLSRSGAVDWGALLGLMAAASQHGRDPFTEAVRAQERLFTTKPIFLGVEESLRHPDVPCGLRTDAERARHVRKRVREMLNSQGEWEPVREAVATPVARHLCAGRRCCGLRVPSRNRATRTTRHSPPTTSPIPPSDRPVSFRCFRCRRLGKGRHRDPLRPIRRCQWQDLRSRPHGRGSARRGPRSHRQMGPPAHQLEWPPSAVGRLGGEDRPAGLRNGWPSRKRPSSASSPRRKRSSPRSASPI